MNSYIYSLPAMSTLRKYSAAKLRSAFAVFALLLCSIGLLQSSAEAKTVTNLYSQGFEGKGMPKGWDYWGYWYWSSGGYGDYNGSAAFNFWDNWDPESNADGSLVTPTFDLSAYSAKSDELYVEFDMWFEYEYYNNFGDDYIDFFGQSNNSKDGAVWISSYATSSDYTFYNPKDEGYQYDPIPDQGFWRHVKIAVPYELRTESAYFWFQSATKAAGGNFAIDNFEINVEQDLMISSTPSFLEFGKTSVGIATEPQSITITNESAATLNISSISKSGPNPNDFQFVGELPTSVEPFSSATISVLFLPTLNGEKFGRVNISNNSENLPLITVELHGVGASPSIELIPIGTVNTPNRMYKKTRTLLGDTLKQSFLVKNTGEGILFVSESSFINGDNPGMYAITRWPAALAEGMTDTMTVRFIPTIEGSDPARLNVENNGFNGRQIVDLFGVGVLPHIEVTPGEMITFDSIAMGVTVCKQVTITNSGSDALRITNDYLSSSDGDFSYTGLPRVNGVATILPGQSATVNVCITPLQNGTRRARLRFTTNIPMTFPTDGPRQDTSVKSVEIWANAVPSDRTSVAIGDFSDAVVGTEASAVATFTNIGSEVITVEEPFFNGANADDFKVTKANFPLTVAPGTSISFTVVASAKVRGENSAVINIANTSEDRQYLQRMNLKVNGLLASSSLHETALNFDKLYLGEESSKTVIVENTGDVDQVYTATLVGAGFTLTSDATSDAVAPGSSAVYTVKFAPSFKGSANGTLTLKSAHITDMAVALSGDADEKPVTQSVKGDVAMKGFVLSQNAPNPASRNTTFNFTSPNTSDVRIILADMTGKTVRELANGVYSAGLHALTIETSDIPSGSYVYILESEGVRLVRQMVISK